MLDFPASPTNGQLFNASNGGTYQWDGTIWLPIGNTTATIYVGDTPPASPIANQFWFNSALGQTFLWYNDGNTTQWVPANPATSQSLLTGDFSALSGGFSPPSGGQVLTGTVQTGNAGNWFNGTSYTPPAGRYLFYLTFYGYWPSGSPGNFGAYVYKNGASSIVSGYQSVGGLNLWATAQAIGAMDANGTDAFTFVGVGSTPGSSCQAAYFGATPISRT